MPAPSVRRYDAGDVGIGDGDGDGDGGDVAAATDYGIWREGILGTREATADLLFEFGREHDSERFAEFSGVGVGVSREGQVDCLAIPVAQPIGADRGSFDGLAGVVRKYSCQDRLRQ